MHLFLALGLFIVCGMVDATFYNPRSQTFNQLMERRQRSIPIPYSYGYHYNPIEPSINVLDSLSEGLDSRINTFKPIYQNVKMSTQDVNSVPRTQYQPKNSLYDSEYISAKDIPSLFPEEDSYDYKYLGSPLNKYLTRPSTQESGIAINLVAIKETSVFDYGFPTYKSPYSSDSVWNFGSKIPNTVFEDPQSVESDPNTFKVSSPTIKIVKLLPETPEQESIISTAKNYELNYKTTQETPTEAELYPITSEEFQTEDEWHPMVTKENTTKDESSFITTEEPLTEDKSNSITIEKTQTEDESNSIEFNSIRTEEKSNSITTEENQKEDDESMSTTSQETTTAFNLNDTFDTNRYSSSHESLMLRIRELMKNIADQQNKSQFRTVDNIPAKSQSNLSSDESTNQQFEPQLVNGADTYK